MIIEIPRKELAYKNKKIEHCIYLNSHGTVYKDCEKSFNTPDFLKERLLYVSKMPIIEGYTRPLNILADKGNIYGYEMEYLKGYESLVDFIYNLSKHLPFEQKKNILLKILKCLKEINKSYIIGDIRLDNIMVNKSGDVRIIDWENGTPLEVDFPILSYYDALYMSNNAIQADSMKMFICILSLLYEFNMENICINFSFNELHDFAFNLNLDSWIKKYLDDYAYEFMTKGTGVIYFDEYLQKMQNLRASNISRVRKRIAKYDY